MTTMRAKGGDSPAARKPDDLGDLFRLSDRQRRARREFFRTRTHARLCRLVAVLDATRRLVDGLLDDDAGSGYHLDAVYGEPFGSADRLRASLAAVGETANVWHGVLHSQLIPGGTPAESELPALVAALAR